MIQTSLATLALGASLLLVQPAVVPSGVTRWAAPVAGQGVSQRPLLRGSTTDLADLEVRAVTLPALSTFRATGTTAQERLVIVKAGRVAITVGGVRHVVGPGSVAVVLPGDAHEGTNAGGTAATLHTFVYRSKVPPDPARGRDAGGSFVVGWDSVTGRGTAEYFAFQGQ